MEPGYSSAKKMRLEKCVYGANCYRKNALHLARFEHPSKSVNSTPTENQSDFDHSFLCLTKVDGCDGKTNVPEISLSEILTRCKEPLERSAQFNFMFSVDWLLLQYPATTRHRPLLLVHGGQVTPADVAKHGNISQCHAHLPIPYGTHHTKMMLLQYECGLRVVVTTANLIPGDWALKTQGVWLSPLFPPTADGDPMKDSTTGFGTDLLDYLSSYNRPTALGPWIEAVRHHDFSTCSAFFLASSPGKFSGPAISRFGHLKLRKVLQSQYQARPGSCRLIGQFSSIGSLGPSASSWLQGEFQQSLSASSALTTNERPHVSLQLVYPCEQDVRDSLEGYEAGVSLPYRDSVHRRQTWIKDLLHCWRAASVARNRASPHVKSYCRLGPNDHDEVEWLILTSANLSKAAWGSLENQKSQLSIRSYEVGVLLLGLRHRQNDSPLERIFLPYDLPLTPYEDDDEPWVTDKQHTEPDMRGKSWTL